MLRGFEAVGTFPSVWHELVQVHIPKPNACRPGDGAFPVSKLRPISLLSAFWRTYMSAAGARRGRDAGATFAQLAAAYARGYNMCSLDLAKAFDMIDVPRAIATLSHYGFPSLLITAVSRIWQGQRRFLTWYGETMPMARLVSSSIPQGDSLSPSVVNLLLSAAARLLMNNSLE